MRQLTERCVCFDEWLRVVCSCASAVLVKVAVLGPKHALQENHICADAEGWKLSQNHFMKKVSLMHLSILNFQTFHWCSNRLTTTSISVLCWVIFARIGFNKNLSTSLIGTNFCKPFVILADVMSLFTSTWELSWGGLSWMALPSPTSKSLMICHYGGVNCLYDLCISLAPTWVTVVLGTI